LAAADLQQLAQNELQKELDIKFEILPQTVKSTANGVEIGYTENGEHKILHTDFLLSATGRNSNLTQLKLEKINPAFNDAKRLPVDAETKQLADYPVFIAGDAHTATPIQHEAAHEGRTAVQNCLNFPNVQSMKTLTPLGIVFSSPEMAVAGKSFKQLADSNAEFVTGTASYEKQGRAIVLGKNRGAAEIYVDKISRKILGAELFTESAEHLAHLLAWMIAEDLTVDEVLNKPFYHPALEEGLRTALKHALRQL